MHGEARGHRRLGTMAAAWLAVSVGLGLTTPAARIGQAPAVDLTAAVDAWLAGDEAGVIGASRLPAAEVRARVARLLTAWGAGDEEAPAYPTAPSAGMAPDRSLHARRQGVRRTQALASLALQVLLETRVAKAEATAWEEVTRAADTRLARVTQAHLQEPADRRQLATYRGWWLVTYLQFLHEARRTDFDAVVGRTSLEGVDEEIRAEFHAIRGLRAEYMSRLAPSGRPVPEVDLIGGEPVNAATQGARGRWLRRWLGTADGLFAEAVRRDPAHEEARLHWGRVALERDRADDAIERLSPLVRVPCADTACGLAALFTGEAHEQAGRLAEADRAYAQASSAPTVRPHALIALMGLAVRRGESSGTALTRHLESGTMAPSTTTAWNAYLNGKRLDPGAVIMRLRAAVVGPPKNGG
ncbi:hypothetical protein TBR22_A46210 [Luteitalea sp. TBR-22]|nr:hypothetical protein TBR22_A46210 [Luteitalea sp. TBR-22]